MNDGYDFQNGSFFLFSIKQDNTEFFRNYLENDVRWRQENSIFITNYILRYASNLTNPDDKRLIKYSLAEPEKYPLYLFENSGKNSLYNRDRPASGNNPKLEGVNIYTFDSGVSFLEFHILYGKMDAEEIEEFIYKFRSLRFNETDKRIKYPDNKYSAEKMIEKILDPEIAKIELCFENPSNVKRQAYVYTALNVKEFCNDIPDEKLIRKWCYYISKGFPKFFDYSENETVNEKYAMNLVCNGNTYWNGCQDGLVCLVTNINMYQYNRIINDYYYVYLLLLNQRFSMISYIEEISVAGDGINVNENGKQMNKRLEKLERLRNNIVSINTRYSFRVVSDDYYVQTVYSKMYDTLTIDDLMKDVEESYDQLNNIISLNRRKSERLTESLLTALSILAIFSSLVDLTGYLDRFVSPENMRGAQWISLAVNLLILAGGIIWIFTRQNRKRK